MLNVKNKILYFVNCFYFIVYENLTSLLNAVKVESDVLGLIFF